MDGSLHASRRHVLLGSGALFASACGSRIARAEGRDPRLLTIVLRGALDGLAAVAPVGDADWNDLRGDLGLRLQGRTPALPLDDFFALNPAMPNFHRLYRSGQALVVHAAATPYRDRSHFDGQDVLENGLPAPAFSDSGWLNRALGAMPADGRINPRGSAAFATGPMTPLIVRGPAPVIAWTPQRLQPASPDTAARLFDLYQHRDPELAQALANRGRLMSMQADMAKPRADGAPQAAGAQLRAGFAESAAAAARLLARDDGPRVGALAYDGWDTHINEGAFGGQLANLLGALDGALAAIESGMGPAWRETAVIVVTEFGRTAKINGAFGTDHGTATAALLAGGALKGGRVVADWPGLKTGDLYQGRDLKPTTDLRSVFKGLLRDHLRLETAALEAAVFPHSAGAPAMSGLLLA